MDKLKLSPPKRQNNPPKVAEPVKATTKAGAPRSMDALRKRTLDAVNKHDWDAFLALCDPKNLREQRTNGVNDTQYVIEALNLHTKDNSLQGDVRKRATLNQISRLTLDHGNGTSTLHGTATLTNGKTLAVTIDGSKQADGSFLISPALG